VRSGVRVPVGRFDPAGPLPFLVTVGAVALLLRRRNGSGPAPPLFILVVAAFSLTVSVVSGLIERRRSFARLRACGVRLGELRQIVLLETAVPMLLTVLVGLGSGLAISYGLGLTSSGPWSPPGPGFFASLGIGVAAALAGDNRRAAADRRRHPARRRAVRVALGPTRPCVGAAARAPPPGQWRPQKP
jgi:hypothetical protein